VAPQTVTVVDVIRYLPLIMALLPEVADLFAAGGNTRQNLDEAVEKAYAVLLAVQPQLAAVVPRSTMLQIAGGLYEATMGVATIVQMAQQQQRVGAGA
jgi:hypothetical protein